MNWRIVLVASLASLSAATFSNATTLNKGDLFYALWYAEKCPGLELDVQKAMAFAKSLGLPDDVSSITIARNDGQMSLAVPVLNVPEPVPSKYQCDLGLAHFGPDGTKIKGLLRSGVPTTNASISPD
ncbi:MULTISPECIES: hypothetical protein [unclassified Mesorhizobium]|uniref:hypothetical protein n=1 Tax=unclassified Mesorhizobium TaxID=325217 RepID=UPI0012EB1F9F|nr:MULTISPECIES: hypothetical protein [unclassified Mesorhizobium]WJI55145.1 hypothetical protein NLY33_18070 [Mesorhizobium sp. C432A]